LPGLEKDGRAIFRGILTGSGLSASDTGTRMGFEFATGDLGELLGDGATQAVIIASRHHLHASQAAAALDAGKTVFVEKPLCLTRSEFADVVEAWRRSPADLLVGFNRRFSPFALEVKAALADRKGPAAILIRANAGAIPGTHWTQRLDEGGGRILGEVCHFVDLACHFAGAEPMTVYAAATRADTPPALSDTLTIALTFADGSIATVLYAANGDASYPKERVEVFCEGGVWVIDDFKTLESTVAGLKRRKRVTSADKGHRAEMRALLDLAQGRPTRTLTFADCAVSTAATFAVIESLTTGVPVAPTVPRLNG
ncbi:MAG TPA: Gfo/Idh/MocA family oxidoreductase, partial [Thermoleophilia bacterium]|nr:Gfo/Idh/MocA family oxidoreductase [Thermoleophilia bacterium]